MSIKAASSGLLDAVHVGSTKHGTCAKEANAHLTHALKFAARWASRIMNKPEAEIVQLDFLRLPPIMICIHVTKG